MELAYVLSNVYRFSSSKSRIVQISSNLEFCGINNPKDSDFSINLKFSFIFWLIDVEINPEKRPLFWIVHKNIMKSN